MSQIVMQNRWNIKNIAGYIDSSGELFKAWNVRGVPFSVLFDKYGKEVKTFEGMPSKAAIVTSFKNVTK